MGTIQESFWDVRKNPLVFSSVAYLTAVSSNLASTHVAPEGIMREIVLYGPPLLLIFVILSPFLERVVPRRRIQARPTVYAARKYSGLVALASPGGGIETARAAVNYHRPELRVLWLLCSKTSGDAAKGLAADLVRSGSLRTDDIHLVVLSDDDFADPERVRSTIESEVYAKLPDGLTEENVIIDITGGKKETTAGAFLAGLPGERHLQVVRALSVDERGRGLVPGPPIEINIAFTIKKAKEPL